MSTPMMTSVGNNRTPRSGFSVRTHVHSLSDSWRCMRTAYGRKTSSHPQSGFSGFWPSSEIRSLELCQRGRGEGGRGWESESECGGWRVVPSLCSHQGLNNKQKQQHRHNTAVYCSALKEPRFRLPSCWYSHSLRISFSVFFFSFVFLFFLFFFLSLSSFFFFSKQILAFQ